MKDQYVLILMTFGRPGASVGPFPTYETAEDYAKSIEAPGAAAKGRSWTIHMLQEPIYDFVPTAIV